MIEIQLKADRGSFHLDLACTLASPWSVIFGPSGAGKSTLLRIIAGLESPDSGQILLDGKCLTDIATGVHLRPGKRSTGMVAQRSALFPHLTVTENIAYGITHILPHRRKERIGLMLELVGGKELASRMPSALSGGESQRVSLARAMAPMPRLLLLDEPLSALDAAGRDEILERLQVWLNAENIQTILVTHDAADALATGAEVVSIHEGKLTGLGPAHLVLADERNRLLARLLSSTAST